MISRLMLGRGSDDRPIDRPIDRVVCARLIITEHMQISVYFTSQSPSQWRGQISFQLSAFKTIVLP